MNSKMNGDNNVVELSRSASVFQHCTAPPWPRYIENHMRSTIKMSFHERELRAPEPCAWLDSKLNSECSLSLKTLHCYGSPTHVSLLIHEECTHTTKYMNFDQHPLHGTRLHWQKLSDTNSTPVPPYVSNVRLGVLHIEQLDVPLPSRRQHAL